MGGSCFLVDPGILNAHEVCRAVEPYGEKVRLIVERRRLGEYSNKALAKVPLVYPDFSKARRSFTSEFRPQLWSTVLDDHQTFMLYDRTNRRLWETNSLKVAKVSRLIQKAQEIILRENISHVMFNATPHNIFTWVFAKVAEYYEAPILYFQQSLLPWRFYLLEGLRKEPEAMRPSKVPDIPSMESGFEQSLVLDFMRNKKGTADIALPEYERKRLAKHKGKPFHLWAYVKDNVKKPFDVLNVVSCYSAYKRLAIKQPSEAPFVIFFLHYQPERTTLPEAYGYAQQILAITAIKSALPENVEMFVKEHPSTFRNRCSWRERSPSFYKMIVDGLGVRLLSMEYDSYKAVDEASVVATVAGTIAYEACLRGRRTVVFSNHGFSRVRFPELHIYSTPESLREFITSALQSELAVSEQNPVRWFNELKFESYSGIDGSFRSLDDVNVRSSAVRQTALMLGLKDTLEHICV